MSEFRQSGGHLWSLLDMVILEARPLLNTVLALAELERAAAKIRGVVTVEFAAVLNHFGETVAADCEKLHLQEPADAARGIANSRTTRDIETHLEFIRNSILIGLNRRKFFEPEPSYLKYFENAYSAPI